MSAPGRKALTLFEDYHSMMADQIRLSAYTRAIAEVVREGDLVIDLGAGLGVLGFLALRAGARHVIAIEKGDSIELARRVAADNGLSDKITFIEELSTEVGLSERADVLVSETLGSFGVDENTLEFTLDARDRLLVPGGRMIPNELSLYLGPAQHAQRHRENELWRDIAGFDYSAALESIGGRMSLEQFSPTALMAECQRLAKIDLTEVRSPKVAGKLIFPITQAGAVHGLCGFFRARLCEGVEISTGPHDPPTHWKQAFFPYREPVSVIAGDFMEVTLSIGPGEGPADDTQVSYDFRCTQMANEKPPAPIKAGRNDPCPCGSGKKYKRCCR